MYNKMDQHVNSFEGHTLFMKFRECMTCKLLKEAVPTTKTSYDKM